MLAVALLVAGCGSGSSSQSSRTAAERPSPSTARTAPTAAAPRKSEKPAAKAKSDALRQAIEEGSPGTSTGGRVLRGAAARRIVQQLISSGSVHGARRLKTRVKGTLHRLLHPGKGSPKGQSVQGLSRRAVREILGRAGAK